MSELHVSIAEGKPSEVLAIEGLTVDEYYTFLLANNARCERIKKDMEKARTRNN